MAKSGHEVLLDEVDVQLFDDPDVNFVVGVADERSLVDRHQPAGVDAVQLHRSLSIFKKLQFSQRTFEYFNRQLRAGRPKVPWPDPEIYQT
jgi:hypothetical protein